MTVVSMLSLKGSPGVTTLACLVAAAWPGPGSVMVLEADPAGGDLAARFALSSRTGWPSFSSSTRRSDDAARVDPHLQELPGGLPVLVGARGGDRRSARSPEGEVLLSRRAGDTPPGLVLVDLGRSAEGDGISESWLNVSDVSILVVRGDACTVVQVRERSEALLRSSNGRLGIVVVGGGRYGCREVSEFTGITPLGEIPLDTSAADVASGASGAVHRLERSLLWIAASRLATTVAARIDSDWATVEDPTDAVEPPGPATSPPSARRRSRSPRILGSARRSRDARDGRKVREPRDEGEDGQDSQDGHGKSELPDGLAPVVA